MYNTFVKPIDAILNRFTMYRVVLYGLIGVLIIAVVLAAVGVLGVSALGLLGTTTILIGGCYAANKVLSWTFRAPTNSESCVAAYYGTVLRQFHQRYIQSAGARKLGA